MWLLGTGKVGVDGGVYRQCFFFSPQILFMLRTGLRSEMGKGGNGGATASEMFQVVILDISWYLYFHVTIFESWTINLVLLVPSQFCNTGKILQHRKNA